MPRPQGAVQTQEKNAGGVTFIDWEGKTLPQSFATAGGNISIGDVENLANAIADCSNACYFELRNNETRRWGYADMRVHDEANASVESVIVLVFPHDTDPDKNREVLIPAYDAQYIMPGGAVNINAVNIQAVITQALQIFNDDDNLANPDNYQAGNVYAFTSKRKVGGQRGVRNKNIPVVVEPGATMPGDAPGLPE